MAKIWFVKNDTFPMRGHKQADRSVQWCIERLGLAPKQRALSAGVIGGARLRGADGCDRVVVAIGREDDEDLDTANWPRGCYLLKIDVNEARKALGIDPPADPA